MTPTGAVTGPILEPIPGREVFLRRPEPEDLLNLHYLVTDPRTSLLSGSRGVPPSKLEHEDFHTYSRWDGNLHLAVVERQSGRTVGAATIDQIDWPTQTTSVGIRIIPSLRNRGLATDACRARDAFLLWRMGLRRLEWRCAESNAASSRIAARLGYALEGRRRAAVYLDGRWEDELLFGLLRSEAEEAPAFAEYRRLVVPRDDEA